MTPKASILISSYNRLPLFRRTLWAIVNRPPSCSFEVVVVDDGSTDDILGELEKYKDRLAYTFVRFKREDFEKATGLKRFHNNPCVTNNIAFKYSRGSLLFQQGNEIIPFGACYNNLLKHASPSCEFFLAYSTTLDVPQDILNELDADGITLSAEQALTCANRPLQSPSYRAGVSNYLSVCSRHLWETLGGYDERYYAGISADDSDFTRRAKLCENLVEIYSDRAYSLHQYHHGKTCYYDPPPEVITKERWEEGVAINRTIYDAWNGRRENPQTWPVGEYGVVEVIRNKTEPNNQGFFAKTEHPVAFDSPDHLEPRGTMWDSSRWQPFNQKLYDLFGRQIAVLDLGCAGGGFVKSLMDDGHISVGLEGSDYCLKRQIREWRTIPFNLFTCDVTKPFSVENINQKLTRSLFDVVTCWELMEHIRQDVLQQVVDNVLVHLKQTGLWIMSVCPGFDGIWHQTVNPKSWWVSKLLSLGHDELVLREDLLKYFDNDWIRGPQQRAHNSFHIVLEKK